MEKNEFPILLEGKHIVEKFFHTLYELEVDENMSELEKEIKACCEGNNINDLKISGNKVSFKVKKHIIDHHKFKKEIENKGFKIKECKYTGEFPFFSNIPIEKYIYQLYSHLEYGKKVLYTNGLIFYFLTQKNTEDNTCIEIIKIGDLEASFKAYEEEEFSYDMMQKTINDWNDLLQNLTNIDWYAEPKTVIR